MKNLMLSICSVLLLFMVYVIIDTSSKSNLFTEFSSLAGIPWMKATLIDFYLNVSVIFAWIAYRERTIGSKAFWLVLLVFLGSVGTLAYIILQLLGLKKGESVRQLLLQKSVDGGVQS